MTPHANRSAARVKLALAFLTLCVVLLCVALVFLVFWISGPVMPPGPEENPNLKMGNPSGATTDPRNKNNFLMEKKFFSLAYNNSKGTANWVSWRLIKEDMGDTPRGQFYPDLDLPRGFVRITPRDYTGGGFDRGHQCPHSDRDATEEMSQASFVMTNMVPQSPNLNQKAWAQLEVYCRGLVEHQNKRLYIVAGPAGQGGAGRDGPRETIGSQHPVTVPRSCWKVIMVLSSSPGDDLMQVDGGTRLIAVIMPNDMSVGNRWARYRVTVKAVEQLTGYKFFDKVPESTIGPLKERVDKERIPATRSPRRGERSEPDVE